jgi:hypothetical protein
MALYTSLKKPRDGIRLLRDAMIFMFLSGFGLGVLLDFAHLVKTSLDRECYIWGLGTGFTFYVPVIIAFLISVAYLLAFLGISRTWFKVLIVPVSIAAANLCMILTYAGMARRCDVGSEFGMALVFGMLPATIFGILYAILIIGSSESVPREQQIPNRKKVVYIVFNILFILVLVITCFPGLVIRPGITGIVVDAYTSKPVRDAWIKAYLVFPRSSIPIEPPHTRTDDTGRFRIPMKISWGMFSPFNLWKRKEVISVKADAVDDRFGSIHLYDYDWKVNVDITIPVKLIEEGLNNEKEYYSYLQYLTDYCYSGRYEEGATEKTGGCDKWEREFTISKYERYAERYKDDRESGYYYALRSLADLYEKNGNYEKAIESYQKRIAFIERDRPSDGLWDADRKGAEYHIKRLQALLSEANKQQYTIK